MVRVTERWNAHLGRKTCSLLLPQPLTRCSSKMPWKTPVSHARFSRDTPQFSLAAVSTAHSCREGLATGCHGNCVSMSCKPFLIVAARIQGASRTQHNRAQTTGSTVQNLTGVLNYVSSFHSRVKDMALFFCSAPFLPLPPSDWNWVTLQVLLSLSFFFLLFSFFSALIYCAVFLRLICHCCW